jgi:hypothetical protein
MRFFGILVALLIIATPVGAIDRMVDGFPDLPKDAHRVAERSLGCQHFWGEINGTGEKRDKEIAANLKQLRCDRVKQDMQNMRTKHRGNERILKVLSEATFD